MAAITRFTAFFWCLRSVLCKSFLYSATSPADGALGAGSGPARASNTHASQRTSRPSHQPGIPSRRQIPGSTFFGGGEEPPVRHAGQRSQVVTLNSPARTWTLRLTACSPSLNGDHGLGRRHWAARIDAAWIEAPGAPVGRRSTVGGWAEQDSRSGSASPSGQGTEHACGSAPTAGALQSILCLLYILLCSILHNDAFSDSYVATRKSAHLVDKHPA